jgi:hypothetical protein
MLAIEVPAAILDTRAAKTDETSKTILPSKCLMLDELLPNDPTHYHNLSLQMRKPNKQHHTR